MVSILIAALGGEGGGVLADWIVTASTAQGLAVQSTSIPGVAQRTGATTYYVEMKDAGVSAPFALAPVPGQVDVVLASELLEAGRAMLTGFVTPERTTLIASTHRIYTTAEKMQMGDGRYDTERVLGAAHALAKQHVLHDMQALARESGAVINAVLFGALVGSGATPLRREACEQAIRSAGKGTEPSLRGFALGFEHAAGEKRRQAEREQAIEAGKVMALGEARAADYLDHAYAALYRERLAPLVHVEPRLLLETARYLALWMCYEDVARVADLKSRRSRFARVRAEAGAKANEPVHLIEFFKPRVEEFAGILPAFIGEPLARWSRRSAFARRLNVGLHVKTSSVTGLLMLRTLAAFKWLRRSSGRFAEEQALIERWLAAIVKTAPADAERAYQIALCARLIKGYGDTHERGQGNFLRLFEHLIDTGATAQAIREAREAALADAEGHTLDATLQNHGVAPRPVKAKPIAFIRRPTEERKAA